MSTIIDVCKLAGVSKTTVSRVINGTGQVKQSTKDAVNAAMEQLGYRPNSLAQALARSESNSIGLVLSDFMGPYYGKVIKQASLCSGLVNKELFIADGHNDCKREYEAILSLEDRRCDAIVLYSRTMSIELLHKLKQQLSVPLVVINHELSDPIFHSIHFDQAGAVRILMDHLIGFGHRKIACITGPLGRPSNDMRFKGFQEALKQFAMPFNSNLVKHSDYTLQGGYDACQKLIDNQQPFSALLAFNDDMALGALKALTDAGIRVPEQVSVTGIDNCPMASFSHPALTSIDLPIEEMTKLGIEIAMKLASGKVCTVTHQYKGKLISRDSVLPFHSDKNWFTC